MTPLVDEERLWMVPTWTSVNLYHHFLQHSPGEADCSQLEQVHCLLGKKLCMAGPREWEWWVGMKLNPVGWSQAMFIYVFSLLLRSIYFLEAVEYRSSRLLALQMRVSFYGLAYHMFLSSEF